MKKLIILPRVPDRTISNGIRIVCQNGSIEYRNIVRGQQEYEIPAITEAIAAYADTPVEMKDVDE